MQTQVVTLDVLKPIGTTVDLSDSFNARVGDKMTPFQLFITEGGVAKDLKGMHPELEAEVGNGALRNGVAVMAAGAKGVHWVGSTNNVTGYNQLTLAFPAEVFPQSGFCYGHLILANDAGVRETSVDIWFQVLDGTPLMGLVADHYDSELQLELAKAKNANDQFSQEMREKYQAEVKKNEDMSAETRASLSKLADDVGHVQSLINTGDVVPRTEYQKNKEATDTAVEANTKELQSHDAQLKQLTASPASDGTAEITNARIGSDEQSSRTYDTLGEAIRDQVGQTTRAIKQSLTSYPAFPFKKEDGVAYSKDGKSTTSASNYYFNIAGSPLVEIKTTVEPYVNFFTFLDASGNVLDYQRNDDKQATVDYVVVPPLKATTLVLGAEAGAQNAHDSVTAFAEKIETGKLYQGSLSSPGLGLESGPLRASLVINSDKYENLVSVDGGYQVSDDHLDTWADKVLIPQGSGVKYVTLRKSDNSAFAATDAYAHCKLVQIPKANIHLKSYENGLTDISDRFRLSYNNILADDKDYHYYNYNKGIQTGLRVASQFVTVDKPESWLIDLQRGYEVSFVTALRDDEGQNISHEFYDNHDVLKTATNWVPQTDQGNANALDNNWSSDHIYENLYPQGAYALVFRKSDGSLVTINDIWDHIRIYKVDNTVHFPDYYRNHMADRVRTINSKLTNPNDFGFGFITDVHAEFNAKHFPALIDEIRTKTPVDEFMGGGDWATGWFDTKTPEDNKPELLTFFEELRCLFKGVPLLKTIGNHEWAYGANNSYNISSQELYGYYLRDEDKMFNDIHWGPDHTYYYWDNQQAKCRYISLNVMDYSDTLKPTGNSDNKEWYFKVGDEQINWLKATLNSVPDGYVVAIESHLVPLNADQFASFPAAKIGTTISNGEDLQAIVSAYVAKTGEFASAKGDLLGWFGGHYHADDITVRNGVTYITTIADCMSIWDIKGAPQKTAGTVSEQAFDVATVDRANRKVNLIRIGDGSDRSFTY
ncbi:metallophosphoesterase family protein [Limosilactobacillus reuteri]|uniref:metallophosphoesterase family protein n=1 Tax=Limosilactobacillus reuteri TaxID=1598 RepID=UPI0024B9CAFE|nr:metallophosphoesterase [Limosilactobacillus reuteri]